MVGRQLHACSYRLASSSGLVTNAAALARTWSGVCPIASCSSRLTWHDSISRFDSIKSPRPEAAISSKPDAIVSKQTSALWRSLCSQRSAGPPARLHYVGCHATKPAMEAWCAPRRRLVSCGLCLFDGLMSVSYRCRLQSGVAGISSTVKCKSNHQRVPVAEMRFREQMIPTAQPSARSRFSKSCVSGQGGFLGCSA